MAILCNQRGLVNPIDPNTIQDGDPVVIQDTSKNVLQGFAAFDHEGRMVITAFGRHIPFAKWSNQGRNGLGSYSSIKGIKIVGHEPSMLPYDIVPKKRFGGNPT